MFDWLLGPKFMGVRLKSWHYLGRTKLMNFNSDGKIHSQAWVYLFCKKNDFSKRHYVLEKGKNFWFDGHGWIINYAPLWKAGEHELYHAVGNEPSNWLKNYLLDTENVIWDNESLDWVDNNIPIIEKGEGNVIKLSFPNIKKDVDAESKV